MEDSVSALAIKPVEKPKKLLDNIITQLIRDWEHKPTITHWYRVENRTYPKRSTTPVVSSCKFHAGAGIELKPSGNFESFSFEGPVKLSPRDSAGIMFTLGVFSTHLPILDHVHHLSFDNQSPKEVFKKLMSLYDVKVYSITDNSGRGVYRVNYSPKKSQVTESNWEIMMYTYTGTAYFDSNTLRLTQVKAVRTRNKAPEGVSVFSITPISPLSPSAASLASSTYRKRYQIDYDGSGTKPIIKQIRIVVTEDNKVIAKTKVQKLN